MSPKLGWFVARCEEEVRRRRLHRCVGPSGREMGRAARVSPRLRERARRSLRLKLTSLRSTRSSVGTRFRCLM